MQAGVVLAVVVVGVIEVAIGVVVEGNVVPWVVLEVVPGRGAPLLGIVWVLEVVLDFLKVVVAPVSSEVVAGPVVTAVVLTIFMA